MQNEPITFATEARIVSETAEGQTDAFYEAMDEIYDCDPDPHHISNANWERLFGLYWGLKSLVDEREWSAQWKRIRACIVSGDRSDRDLNAWRWFTTAMNWRRTKARTDAGDGAKRWQAMKAAPRKHAEQKARNAEAQRRRRARQLPVAAE